MLTFNINRLLKVRGVEKPFQYLVKAGFCDNFATRITKNKTRRMDLREVERLCELFRCTPNDLLEWEPSPEQAAIADHPLKPLERAKKVEGLSQLLNAIPLDKLEEIESLIKERCNTIG